jgi:hypothetical protein
MMMEPYVVYAACMLEPSGDGGAVGAAGGIHTCLLLLQPDSELEALLAICFTVICKITSLFPDLSLPKIVCAVARRSWPCPPFAQPH